MAIGDLVRRSRKRTERKPRPAQPTVIQGTAEDLDKVQETWRIEARERGMFMPRLVEARPELSSCAKSIMSLFERVLFKHHPEGLPGIRDDWWEEP